MTRCRASRRRARHLAGGLCALLAAGASPSAGMPTGAPTCNAEAVHGTRLRGGGVLALRAPAAYDSRLPGAAVNVSLVCLDAACAVSAQNGFLLSPLDQSGAPAGTLTPLTPGTQPLYDPACSSAYTHTAPAALSSWDFTWTPGGAAGTVTWQAAVVVGYSTSFLLTACLFDAALPPGGGASGSSSSDTSMAGMDMGRRRVRRRRHVLATSGHHHSSSSEESEEAAPASVAYPVVSDAATSCPAGGAASHAAMTSRMQHGAMMPSTWFARITWRTPGGVVLPGVAVTSPGAFVGLMAVTFALAFATSHVANASGGAEAVALRGVRDSGRKQRGTTPGAAPSAAALAAGGVVLRHGLHYACMLLAMTYSCWVLLALMGGHAASYVSHAAFTRWSARRRGGGGV